MQKCTSGTSAQLPSAFLFVASYQFHICNGILPLNFLPKQGGEKLQTQNKFWIPKKKNHVNRYSRQNVLGPYSPRLPGSSYITKNVTSIWTFMHSKKSVYAHKKKKSGRVALDEHSHFWSALIHWKVIKFGERLGGIFSVTSQIPSTDTPAQQCAVRKSWYLGFISLLKDNQKSCLWGRLSDTNLGHQKAVEQEGLEKLCRCR